MTTIKNIKPVVQTVKSTAETVTKSVTKAVETAAKDTVELSAEAQKEAKTGFFGTLYNAGKTVIKAVFKGVKKVFTGIINFRKKIYKKSQDTIQKVIDDIDIQNGNEQKLKEKIMKDLIEKAGGFTGDKKHDGSLLVTLQLIARSKLPIKK